WAPRIHGARTMQWWSRRERAALRRDALRLNTLPLVCTPVFRALMWWTMDLKTPSRLRGNDKSLEKKESLQNLAPGGVCACRPYWPHLIAQTVGV
ncbi:MAG: hypothetical protein WCI05_15630, partial [Myxococcales bacterium]